MAFDKGVAVHSILMTYLLAIYGYFSVVISYYIPTTLMLYSTSEIPSLYTLYELLRLMQLPTGIQLTVKTYILGLERGFQKQKSAQHLYVVNTRP